MLKNALVAGFLGLGVSGCQSSPARETPELASAFEQSPPCSILGKINGAVSCIYRTQNNTYLIIGSCENNGGEFEARPDKGTKYRYFKGGSYHAGNPNGCDVFFQRVLGNLD